jgi:hypothetical protein
MICADITAAMGTGELCEETEEGARVFTHCLYPSFDPVAVHVVKLGDGYRISDGGGASRSAWIHGRENPLSKYVLEREAVRYRLKVSGPALVADVPSIEWLRSGILAVANASAAVAHTAVGKLAAAVESDLKEKIHDTLKRFAADAAIGTDVEIVGNSGDNRHFDYGVRDAANDNWILMNAVAPHHSSVAAKYVAFADTKDIPNLFGLGVYERRLERGDVSLLMQVTDLVPITSLEPKVRRVWHGG